MLGIAYKVCLLNRTTLTNENNYILSHESKTCDHLLSSEEDYLTPLGGGEREELPDIVIEDFSDCVVVSTLDNMRTQNIRVERGTKVRLEARGPL